MRFLSFLTAMMLVFSAPPVSIKVSPRFAATRSDVRVIVRLEPHADNRWLITTIDGPSRFSKREQLEGENAAKIKEIWFKGMGSGEYVVYAEVFGPGDKIRARSTEELVCISGFDVICVRDSQWTLEKQ